MDTRRRSSCTVRHGEIFFQTLQLLFRHIEGSLFSLDPPPPLLGPHKRKQFRLIQVTSKGRSTQISPRRSFLCRGVQ